MNLSIQSWLEARTRLHEALYAERQAFKSLEDVPNTPPSNLRPATPQDVKYGAVLWYPHRPEEDGGPYWCIVVEVHKPDDPWKAYSAHDGCRYGIEDAYVETEEP